jgi:hypothetical protein
MGILINNHLLSDGMKDWDPILLSFTLLLKMLKNFMGVVALMTDIHPTGRSWH